MAYYENCPEHNGIEIYFDDRPDEEYLSKLRGNRWRRQGIKYSYKFCKEKQVDVLMELKR